MTEIISKQEAVAKGLKYYFPGTPCKHGHVCKRSVRKANDCIDCKREVLARNYKANRSAICARVAAYREANPDKIKRWNKERWEQSSPEERAAELLRLKQWGEDNPERFAATRKRYNHQRWLKIKQEQPTVRAAQKAASHIRNKEKNSARNLAWKRANPGKVQASNSRRRAIAAGSGGSHTSADILEIFNLQNKRCAYCKKSLARVGGRGRHVDHILPLTKGGHDGRSNLQILCQRCNNRKHAKRPEVFARELGMLL